MAMVSYEDNLKQMENDFMDFCKSNNGKLSKIGEIGKSKILCEFEIPLEISTIEINENELEIDVVKSKTPREITSFRYTIHMIENDTFVSVETDYGKVDEVSFDKYLDIHSIDGRFFIRKAEFIKNKERSYFFSSVSEKYVIASTEINLG